MNTHENCTHENYQQAAARSERKKFNYDHYWGKVRQAEQDYNTATQVKADWDARALLSLHQGRCSVPADSLIGRAFAGMQVAGEVGMRLSETPGFVDVSVVKKEIFAEEPDL